MGGLLHNDKVHSTAAATVYWVSQSSPQHFLGLPCGLKTSLLEPTQVLMQPIMHDCSVV